MWPTRPSIATRTILCPGRLALAGVSPQKLPEFGEAGTGAHRSPLPRPTAKQNGATGNPLLKPVGTAPHPHSSPAESYSQQSELKPKDLQKHFHRKHSLPVSDPLLDQQSQTGPTISLTLYAERPPNWCGSERFYPSIPAVSCVHSFLRFVCVCVFGVFVVCLLPCCLSLYAALHAVNLPIVSCRLLFVSLFRPCM